ncbi:MAG: hypothetical protein M1133_04170 [Armatimonadetes bacterium]|nr:hypothetical protein [Armatimonadota bacterium]
MPIPFKDLTDTKSPGLVGYLKFLPRAVGNIRLGALFIMDALGEPVEFTYARIRAPKTLLWRPADLNDYCVRSMCVSMFDTCPVSPLLILCLANEVGPDVFTKHISVSLPVGRLSESGTPSEVAVDWAIPPEADLPAKRLFDTLAARGLLMEPFERVETGLREVYSDAAR